MFDLQNIELHYGPLRIFEQFNLACSQGEFMCLFGASGVGKTSLLNILARLVQPQAGRIYCDNQRLAYVFQDARLIPWLTVEDNIELGLHSQGLNTARRRHRVSRLLPLLELEDFSAYYPGQLSGGMRQRVSLGRAFAVQPDLLLLDEPFTSLDANLKQDMYKLLQDLREWHSCTTVMVTHDEKEAMTLSDRVIVLQGRPCRPVLELYPNHALRGDSAYDTAMKNRLLAALNGSRPDP